MAQLVITLFCSAMPDKQRNTYSDVPRGHCHQSVLQQTVHKVPYNVITSFLPRIIHIITFPLSLAVTTPTIFIF